VDHASGVAQGPERGVPRKKSIRRAAQAFVDEVDETKAFVTDAAACLTDAQVSRVYDSAIITLYRDFENLVLEVLVGAVNNDTTTISLALGVNFPKHLTDEVCRYLITGPSYFDFRGRDGLIKRVRQYVPDGHYLLEILKGSKYKDAVERLCALRNLAAHASPQSRKAALLAVGQKRIGTAGSWLKRQGRFSAIADSLSDLARDVATRAPY